MPSAFFVDIVGCTLFFTPFIFNNIVSILAGIFADTHVRTATILIRLLYFAWFAECTVLSVFIVYAGGRLIRILKENHRKLGDGIVASHMNEIRDGVSKIRAQVIILSVALAVFAIALFLEAILRTAIMSHTTGNVIISVPWMYIGSITTFAFLLAILIRYVLLHCVQGSMLT